MKVRLSALRPEPVLLLVLLPGVDPEPRLAPPWVRRQELPEAKLGPSEDRVVPEYAMYAEFLADTRVTRDARRDTYLCAYKLTRISGNGAGAILWEDQYEASKAVTKGFLD